MANTVISLKKSSTPLAVPASLANGEIAINYADGKLYYKDASGVIQSITGGGAGGNSFGIANVDGTLLISHTSGDVLNVLKGTNIELTPDALTDSFTITANLHPAYSKANDAYDLASSGFDKANAANVLAYNTGIGANAYTNSVGAASNTWANTKLSNTAGVWTAGGLNIPDSLYLLNDITRVNSIFLNTTALAAANGSAIAGQLTWNPDDKTLDVGTGESILQVGQEQYIRIRNADTSTIYNSNAVAYLSTIGNSGKITARLAIANNYYDDSYVMGLATEDIAPGADGFVTTFGKIRKIDTSMFSEGDVLYVSTSIPGAIQNTKPTAPNNKIIVGTVITSSATVGEIFVKPIYGSSIADDELAEVNNLANGDLLVYHSTSGRFENNPQSVINAGQVNGYTATNLLTSANNSANSANAYTVTVGAAGNTAAYIFANGTANSANAYAVTVGQAGNNYTITIATGINSNAVNNAVGANGWANSLSTLDRAIANSAANSANIYAMVYANGTANSANSGKVTSVSGTAGEIYSSGGTTPTLNLINTAVTSSTYGGASQIPVFTVDGKGRLTYAANVTVQGMDYAYANSVGAASNTWANTKLANTSGVSFAGDLYFPTGNVGIGTTAPAANLDVVGSVSIARANLLSQVLSNSSNTIAWDMSKGQIATLYLSASSAAANLSLPTNMRVGSCILHIYQDSAGGRTVNTSPYLWPGGVDPVVTPTANAHDIFSFICDGTSMYGTYIQNVK